MSCFYRVYIFYTLKHTHRNSCQHPFLFFNIKCPYFIPYLNFINCLKTIFSFNPGIANDTPVREEERVVEEAEMSHLPLTVRCSLVHSCMDKPYLIRFKVFSGTDKLSTTVISAKTTFITVCFVNGKLSPSHDAVFGYVEKHIMITVFYHTTGNHTECCRHLKSVIEKVFQDALYPF